MNALVTAPHREGIPRFEPGIHFGVPEDDYHADESLGSTSLKSIALDAIEYQHALLNPGEEKEETEALKWGHAIHCRVLEGRESMAARFPIAPEIKDFRGALDTMADLRRHCRELGISAAQTKADTIKRIREVDSAVLIWDEIMAKFDAANAGKTILPRKAIDHIEMAARWMQRFKKLAPVMSDGTIVAGASEVSIFYVENGVRLKARLDHLLAHAIVDLKSFRPFYQGNLVEEAKKAVARQRYDLQAGAYIKAIRAAAQLYADGRVFNNPYPPEFLASVFTSLETAMRDPRSDDAMKWIWVMIKAKGAPQSVVAEFDLTSMIFKQAVADVEKAIGEYRIFMDAFGPDEEWVREIPAQFWSDTDWSPYAFL